MYFAVTQPGTPAYEVVMTRAHQREFTPQTTGTLLCGPIPVPAELAFLFDEEFHNLLPGPTYEWTLRLTFIAEAMILLGWQQAELSPPDPEEHAVPTGLRSEVAEWIRALREIRGQGERSARRVLEALPALLDLGARAYREDSRMHEALCH